MAIIVGSFTNTDLNGSFQYIYNHGQNTEDVNVEWWDDNDENRKAPNLIKIIDSNNVQVSCGGAITGTHKLTVEYTDAIITNGKRLFEQTLNSNPATDYRFGLGKVGTPAINMTMLQMLTYLTTNLDFMGEELLGVNATAGRSSLSVYSIADVDVALTNKANTSYVDAEILDATQKTAITFSLTGATSNFTTTQVRSVKAGQIATISCMVTNVVSSPAVAQLVGTLSVAPAVLTNFSAGVEDPTNDNSGTGYIDTDGKVYLKTGTAPHTFIIHVPFII